MCTHHDAHDHCHNHHGERGAKLVFMLTVVTMGAEILAGWLYGSMALLADGWHMASHAGALGIAWFAYAFARRNSTNPNFVFGTGKVNALAGFASAIGLLLIAAYMAVESCARLFSPVDIAYGQATLVAVLGLLVNLASVWLLRDSHESHAHDHNIKAAYIHVLADALTSILAIAALLGGRHLGLVWLDPVMGVVGAAVIIRWAVGLLKETGAILLDHMGEPGLAARMRALLEDNPQTSVAGIAVWRVGGGTYAANVIIEDDVPRQPDHYRKKLEAIGGLTRITVEVRDKRCPA